MSTSCKYCENKLKLIVSVFSITTWNSQLRGIFDFDETLNCAEEKQDLLEYLQKLAENFQDRFPDLLTESFDIIKFPFKTNVTQCGSFALEMAELQADNEARVNFDVYDDIANFGLLYQRDIQ